jgi:hypothetical protein
MPMSKTPEQPLRRSTDAATKQPSRRQLLLRVVDAPRRLDAAKLARLLARMAVREGAGRLSPPAPVVYQYGNPAVEAEHPVPSRAGINHKE